MTRFLRTAGALAVAVTATGAAGAVGAPAPVAFTGANVTALVNDIQTYWAAAAPSAYGYRFPKVPASRVKGLTPRTVTRFPCDGGLRWGDVSGNAIGGACSQGPMVLWDATPRGFAATLRRTVGPAAMGFVFAHEFGHVAQAQLGISGSDLFMEQQADCFAGAYTAWGQTHGRVRLVSDPADLDQIARGVMISRDPPGTSPDEEGAHGSGFDRLRAFHDGYFAGARACKSYRRALPPTVARSFDPDELKDGGNLPYEQLVPLVTPDLDAFFASTEAGLAAVPLADVSALADPTGCSRVVDNAVVCPDGRGVFVDHAALAQINQRFGDGATVALLAMAWAQRSAPTAVPGGDERTWDLCRAGNFFRSAFDGDSENGGLSPGDLDEVLEYLMRPVPGRASGEATLAVLSVRTGFFGDRNTCVQMASTPRAYPRNFGTSRAASVPARGSTYEPGWGAARGDGRRRWSRSA